MNEAMCGRRSLVWDYSVRCFGGKHASRQAWGWNSSQESSHLDQEQEVVRGHGETELKMHGLLKFQARPQRHTSKATSNPSPTVPPAEDQKLNIRAYGDHSESKHYRWQGE